MALAVAKLAVIPTCPAASAVTSPDALTRATASLALRQVIIALGTGTSARSRTWAMSCARSPAPSVSVGGVRMTWNSLASRTVIVARATPEPERASMIASPGVCASTSPATLTVACCGAKLSHRTLAPGTSWPCGSRTSAASVRRSPVTNVAEGGVSTIVRAARCDSACGESIDS